MACPAVLWDLLPEAADASDMSTPARHQALVVFVLVRHMKRKDKTRAIQRIARVLSFDDRLGEFRAVCLLVSGFFSFRFQYIEKFFFIVHAQLFCVDEVKQVFILEHLYGSICLLVIRHGCKEVVRHA